MQNALENEISGNSSMHVNQPLSFEGATQRIYLNVKQQSGTPAIHYVDIYWMKK